MDKKTRFFYFLSFIITFSFAVFCILLAFKGPILGVKDFEFEVTHSDGSVVLYDLESDADYLGEALTEEGLIDGEISSYGLFVTTVDNETVDSLKEEWWCFKKGFDNLNTGVDQTILEDDVTYKAVFTVGW